MGLKNSLRRLTPRWLPFLVALGMTWLTLVGLQIVPSLLTAASPDTEAAILAITILVVGVQVGQSVALQTSVSSDPPRGYSSAGWIITAIGLTYLFFFNGPAFLNQAVMTLIGAVLGYRSGIRAMPLLMPGTRVLYQSTFALRNTLWFLATVLVALTAGITPFLATVCLLASYGLTDILAERTLLQFVSRTPSIVTTGTAHAKSMWLVPIFGALASLLYRNDVNIVRSSYIGSHHFLEAHVGLVVYGAVGALGGVLITQLLYPRLRANAGDTHFIRARVRRLSAVHLLLSAVVTSIAYATGVSQTSVPTAISIAVFCSIGTPWVSALVHFERKSTTVYTVGIVAVGALVLLLSLGVLPVIALQLYGLLTQALIWTASAPSAYLHPSTPQSNS